MKKSARKKPAKLSADDRRLIRSAKEMLAHHRCEIELESYSYTPPEKVQVDDIRKELGYNQKQFADHFGFALSAVKDWEQGRRKPERSARILLTLIAANPTFVQQTLAQYRME